MNKRGTTVPRSDYRGVRVAAVMLYILDRRLYARQALARYRRF
jgi:hypothetical protein